MVLNKIKTSQGMFWGAIQGNLIEDLKKKNSYTGRLNLYLENIIVNL